MIGERYFWNLRDDAREKLNDSEFELYQKLAESLIDNINSTRGSSYSNWLRVDNFIEILDDYKIKGINGFKLIIYSRNYNPQRKNNIHAKIIVLIGNKDYKSFDIYKDKRTKYIVLTDDFINKSSLDELNNKLINAFNDCYYYWHRRS